MTTLLNTDGYKFSMGEAGWPLRTETFYYSHRKGGLQVVPFDVKAEVLAALPVLDGADWEYLADNGYEMGPGFKAAIAQQAQLEVSALPQGAWFFDREPVFSLTGPSALVSWLEPLLLQLSYRIQVATVALLHPEQLPAAVGVVTCAAQRELVLGTLSAVKVAAPAIRVDSEGYQARVEARVRELVQMVGDGARLFEVGLRAASCLEQHLLALEACRSGGLTRTSHVEGARALGLRPVGTMGHEHVQRYGSDADAFRAMVERRPQGASFLLDTFDTIGSGIPQAFALISQRAGAQDSIRYDSGDKEAQYRHAVAQAAQLGLRPVHVLEDGFDAAQTRRFEQLRREVGLRPEEQVYGYGGYLVAGTAGTPLTRDRVSAVYKLAQSGPRATMKFGNEVGSGKQSVPGRPVLFRRVRGQGPIGIVGQRGEAPPEGYLALTQGEAGQQPDLAQLRGEPAALAPSPQTQALAQALTAQAFGKAAS